MPTGFIESLWWSWTRSYVIRIMIPVPAPASIPLPTRSTTTIFWPSINLVRVSPRQAIDFSIMGLLWNRLSLVQKFQNRNTNSYFPQKLFLRIVCSWNALFHANFGLLYKKNYGETARSCSFCMSEGQIIFVYIFKYTQLLNPNVC